MHELTSGFLALELVVCGSMLSFGAASDGPEPSEAIEVQARVRRYEVPSEWRGLRGISVRWYSAVQAIRVVGNWRMRFC